MVAGGHWVWDTNGAYFGIPLQNYWGWWLTVFTTFALYLLMSGKTEKPAEAKFDRLALLSYLITALGFVAVSLVSGAGALALIGFFAMMPWVVAGFLWLFACPACTWRTLVLPAPGALACRQDRQAQVALHATSSRCPSGVQVPGGTGGGQARV
jgi:uncharacterized membrane protein